MIYQYLFKLFTELYQAILTLFKNSCLGKISLLSIIVLFFFPAHSSFGQECQEIFTPISSYSSELNQIVKELKIEDGSTTIIKKLGEGFEARAYLAVTKNQKGELLVFVRKVYKSKPIYSRDQAGTPPHIKAKQDFQTLQTLQKLKDQGQLPGFRVAKPIRQEGRILELEYIKGIPLNSLRPGVIPAHQDIYNRYRDAFFDLMFLWKNRVKHLSASAPPSVEKIIMQQQKVASQSNNYDPDKYLNPSSQTFEDEVIDSFLLVEKLQGEKLYPLYQLKPDNIIVEDATQEFIIIDPI